MDFIKLTTEDDIYSVNVNHIISYWDSDLVFPICSEVSLINGDVINVLETTVQIDALIADLYQEEV